MSKVLTVLALALVVAANAFAADNLRLNQGLDYSSDSMDGPLITGDNIDAGAQAGRPNYIIIYGEGCFNSKRQAKRTVELYEKYKDTIAFVIIDLDMPRSEAQQKLVKEYYQGSIPHVVLLDKSGRAIYNSAGEVESDKVSALLDKALQP
jgi:thiol:disulfide interchange protein